MVRDPGCFTRHATPTTRLDSIEALAEIFSLRRGSTALFERRGRPGFAYLAADPHLSGKEDTPFGSISNSLASRVSGCGRPTSKARDHESQQGA